MFFAVVALLVLPQSVTPQIAFSAEKVALIQPASVASKSDAESNESSASTAAVPETAVAAAVTQPVPESNSSELPDAPVPLVSSPAPAALLLAKPSKPMKVSVSELAAENRRKQLLWKGLAIASSGAATFDAWSTRQAITTSGAQELNPLLKPFANNNSLYLAIQAGPVVMDYVGKRMMYSRHGWVRRMWWAPQSASFVTSLFCGAHNLSFH